MSYLLRRLSCFLVTGAIVFASTPRAQALCAFQEGCEDHSDCGHGFECVHGQGSEEGVYTGDCGDDSCDAGETEAECPEDCQGYSHCKPMSCESDSDCATEKNYRCAESFGDAGGWHRACLRPSSDLCCETTADCPRHSFCVIVDDGTGIDAGAAGARGEVKGYCEVGDGTYEDVTVVGDSSSATGTGGTSSSTSADDDGGARGADGSAKPKRHSGGCSLGSDMREGGSSAAALLLGALVLLRRGRRR